MATYYVQPNGADSNTGLGPSNANAWRTVQKALGATGIGSGDTLYIAPGTYRETITVGGTYSTTTTIIGDRTASQFTGITPGYIRITGLISDALSSNTTLGGFTTNGKSYLTFDSIWFEFEFVIAANTTNSNFIRCQFTTPYQPTPGTPAQAVITMTTTGHSTNIVDKCYIQGAILVNGSGVSTGNRFNACLWESTSTGTQGGFELANTGAAGITMSNCTVFGASAQQIFRGYSVGPPANSLFVYNSLIVPSYCQPTFGGANTNCIVENWNAGYISRGGGVSAGANSKQLYHRAFVGNPIYINAVDMTFVPYTPLVSDSLIGAGSASFTYGTDFFGNAWASPPSIGAMELKTYGTATAYLPTERNASTITIAPGSTSQSIELYLGATGLTASTYGLSAYYNRTRSADVQITLVARNITQNWTSGGFAEVNANTMPGVYRLDIPNEALAAGADDVTVVVRGASGTNGAVMSIKLSSGGLTTAQTASAVWGALTNDHTTHGTFGWNVLRADQDSKEGLVTLHQSGGISRVDADVHAIANDTAAATALKGALNHDGTGYVDSDVVRISTSTAAANELEGALLHNGTDYIDSNLLSGNSTRVFVGRFQLTQTGTTQGDIIEAFTTDTPAFELQLFDGDNNIVPVTGATLGLRILDVTSTVVETGTPTIEYGTGGIVRWTALGSYVSIGCPAGMYRLFVDRTVSGTTTTFGPLQIKVQVQ